MRSISKGRQPTTVTSIQCASTTSLSTQAAARTAFDQLAKGAVRAALTSEQGGLCAFCMRRIDPNARVGAMHTMRIAHRTPIAVDPTLALTWKNLFGSCDGGERAARGFVTCDVAQADTPVTVDPSSAASVQQLRYERRATSEGLHLTSDSSALNADLDTLGLNRGDLPALRAEALKAFQKKLRDAHPPSTWTAQTKPVFFATWKSKHGSSLPEFIGVIEAWIASDKMRCR